MSEFRASMRCWLPGKEGSETPFAAAQCEEVEAGGLLKLKLDDGGTVTVDPSKQDVLAGNETGSTAFDHCALIHMNEPCVLENSRLRYLEDEIYTLVGTIMIAINPFMEIDAIYGPEVMKRYAGKELGAVKAHLYAMGETAYRTLLRGGAKRTALVMSGESGAGKTETAKHLMQYIAWCSEGADGGPASGLAAKLANMIIASSPLLEAFGNAKTVRNNNSSRFGKMMRLHFHPSGAMAGAFIKTYLLEKIRVCAITSPERNYHVFYQLLAARPSAASSGLIAKKRPSDMRCLNKSTCVSIERVDDAKGFEEISRAMGELGVESGQQEELWRVLCGLLLLGDVDFDVDGGDKALVSGGSTETITGAEELLMTGNAPIPERSSMASVDSLGEDELEWTPRWYALRPSGLHLYSFEQRGESEWEDPALTVPMSSVVSASTATGSDFWKAIIVLGRESGRDLQLRLKTRHEMRHVLGLLHLHCLRPPGGDGRAWPRSVMMAGWLFLKTTTTPDPPPSSSSSSSLFKRAKNAMGRGQKSNHNLFGGGGRAMVLNGATWQMRWFVLDAEPETAGSAELLELDSRLDGSLKSAKLRGQPSASGGVPRDARLISYDSEVPADDGLMLGLHEVKGVQLRPRETDAGTTIDANFALKIGKDRMYEFAARSEEEAREWVRVFDEILFKRSTKVQNMARA